MDRLSLAQATKKQKLLLMKVLQALRLNVVEENSHMLKQPHPAVYASASALLSSSLHRFDARHKQWALGQLFQHSLRSKYDKSKEELIPQLTELVEKKITLLENQMASKTKMAEKQAVKGLESEKSRLAQSVQRINEKELKMTEKILAIKKREEELKEAMAQIEKEK